MTRTYFDGRRVLKLIYSQGMNAIKRKDDAAINNLLSILNDLEKEVETEYKLDKHGKYLLCKDIRQMRVLFDKKRTKR